MNLLFAGSIFAPFFPAARSLDCPSIQNHLFIGPHLASFLQAAVVVFEGGAEGSTGLESCYCACIGSPLSLVTTVTKYYAKLETQYGKLTFYCGS